MPDFKNAKEINGKWYCWDGAKKGLVEISTKKVELNEATWDLIEKFFYRETVSEKEEKEI